MKTCTRCGRQVDDSVNTCPNCGAPFVSGANQNGGNYGQRTYIDPNNAFDPCGPEGKCRGIAALFAILLGGLGIQYFYLNRPTAGIISIVLSFVTCGIWPVVMLIQGILMFVMTNAEFRQKYILSTSTLPLF